MIGFSADREACSGTDWWFLFGGETPIIVVIAGKSAIVIFSQLGGKTPTNCIRLHCDLCIFLCHRL